MRLISLESRTTPKIPSITELCSVFIIWFVILFVAIYERLCTAFTPHKIDAVQRFLASINF